jgi:hypothetical protein
MVKNTYFDRMNILRPFFLGWSLLIPTMILLISFSTKVFGQVAVPLSQLNPSILKNTESEFSVLKVVGEQLFVGTDEGLWLVSKDGRHATQVVSEPGVEDSFEDESEEPVVSGAGIVGVRRARIVALEVVGDRLFAVTFKGLWVVSKDGRHATKIEQVKGSFYGSPFPPYRIEIIGDRLFISTEEGFWMVSHEGEQVDKIEGVRGPIDSLDIFGERLLVRSKNEGSLIFGKDGKRIGKLERIEGNVSVDIVAIGRQIFFRGMSQETSGDLWVIEEDSNVPEKVKNLEGILGSYTAVGEHLYATDTNRDLWIVDGHGKSATKVGSVNGRVYYIMPVGKHLFVDTSEGVWIIDGDSELATKAKNFRGLTLLANLSAGQSISILPMGEEAQAIGEDVFFTTKDALWVVNVESKVAARVGSVESTVFDIQPAGDRGVVSFYGSSALWIISEGGKRVNRVESIKGIVNRIETVGGYIYTVTDRRDVYLRNLNTYQIDQKAVINTRLIPSGWWASVIDYMLPFNWLPSEKVQATACYSYSNEKCEDPYDKTVPREFRFAIANGDVLPPDDKFSTADQFRYEINWGSNNVHYWVRDKWGNTFEHKASYRGVPSQYFFAGMIFILPAIFVLGCFVSAPKIGFCHSAIMNPWLRNYFSLGSIPLLLSSFASLRRHILGRYASSINKDKEFNEWKRRFIYPSDEFLPNNFGKKLESEGRLLLTGQSGIGKTSFFKHLTAYYASKDKPTSPPKVFPVYIPLINYGGNSLEELVYNQLFSYGKITDRELAPVFLEQGGLLIFLDGVNEVQNVPDRQKLSEFVERFWTSNYICLSSQQSYPEIENIPKVELKIFTPEKVREFISLRVEDHETAERLIKNLKDEDYQLYSIPRDLEFAVEIINRGERSLPKSRTKLYQTTFGSLFAKWKENGAVESEHDLCKHAYTMIIQRDLDFDSVDTPRLKGVTEDLYKQKFLVRREGSYIFRHDLIRAYLASEYFYPRWKSLCEEIKGKPIDSNWLEMLKFSCENIEESAEVKSLIYTVLERSVRKDLVKNLFEWLKVNYPGKCRSWEKDFYAKYGELDFK